VFFSCFDVVWLFIAKEQGRAPEQRGSQERGCQKVQAGDELFAVFDSFDAGDLIDGLDRRAGPGPAAACARCEPDKDGPQSGNQGQNA